MIKTAYQKYIADVQSTKRLNTIACNKVILNTRNKIPEHLQNL